VDEGFEVETRLEGGHESGEQWLTSAIAVTTAVLAVCAALSSLMASRAAHHSLAELNQAAIAQNLASDQWNFYQAKGIKRHVFEVQRDALRLQSSPEAAARVAAYDKEIKRYASEQEQIQKEAKGREHERDEAKDVAQRFDSRYQRLSLSVAFFQIGIVVCSVAAIVRRRFLWYLGLVGGAAGLFILMQEMFVSASGGRVG
jgi:ABC-type nickel/cobalt efflux system permease component RcnA